MNDQFESKIDDLIVAKLRHSQLLLWLWRAFRALISPILTLNLIRPDLFRGS